MIPTPSLLLDDAAKALGEAAIALRQLRRTGVGPPHLEILDCADARIVEAQQSIGALSASLAADVAETERQARRQARLDRLLSGEL